MNQRLADNKGKYRLPRLGMRIIKTTVAVFICLVIYMLRGYKGMPVQSAIAAIVCMQPFVNDSKSYAINRVFGTVLGAVFGLLFLMFLSRAHIIRYGMIWAFAIMALGVLIVLYFCVAIRKADSASLASIVFLCIVIAYPYIEDPVLSAIDRVFDTLLGTIVAICVNLFRLPRKKNDNRLFFVRTKDLVPDRFAQIHSTVLIGLHRLFNDGAKICLISEHAPGFFIGQMGTLNVNVPIIMMDGAALYNTEDKEFCELIEMEKPSAHNLEHILRGMNISYQVYAIRFNTLLIYHEGGYNKYEQKTYESLKRSPYRNYVNGVYGDDDRITFFKVIDENNIIDALEKNLRAILPNSRYRLAVRRDRHLHDTSALYIYSAEATVDNMKKRVVKYVENGENRILTDVFSKRDYADERDALAVLYRVRNQYEPLILTTLFRKDK